MDLNPKQLDILRHMLGINNDFHQRRPFDREPYRDYFCANPGDEQLHELQRLGAVRLYSEHGSYQWFETTSAGRKAAIDSWYAMRKAKKIGKPQRIYSKFLDCRECNQDLTFREFLTHPVYEQTRREA